MDIEKNFDFIILGTDIKESILSGALAQTKSKVIQIDNNPYYGGNSSTFNLLEFFKFLLLKKQNSDNNGQFDNITINWEFLDNIKISNESELVNESINNLVSDLKNKNASEKIELIKEEFYNQFSKWKRYDEYTIIIDELIKNLINLIGEDDNMSSQLLSQAFISTNEILNQSRSYSIEMSNKVLLSDNSATQLLLDSKTHKYLEFRLVNQSCLFTEGEIQKVPISKSDVFNDRRLSLMDKRKMMRFITFALKTTEEPELLNEVKDNNLESYLAEEYKLNMEIIHTIIYLISGWELSSNKLSVGEGIKLCNRFIASLNKYGNHAYLWGLYGTSSEICQAFCRIAAVYGTLHILGHSVTNVELDSNDEEYSWTIDTEIETGLKGRKLITSIDFLPKNLLSHVKPSQYVYKSVFFVNESDLFHPIFNPKPSDNSEEESNSNTPQSLILISVPPNTPFNPYSSPILVMRVSSDTQACPENQAIIYMWMTVDAENRLDNQVNDTFNTLFNEIMNTYSSKPLAVANCHFERVIRKFDISPSSDEYPSNLLVIDDLESELILDGSLSNIFNSFQSLKLSNISDEDWKFFPIHYNQYEENQDI